jgi:hypothetical protein
MSTIKVVQPATKAEGLLTVPKVRRLNTVELEAVLTEALGRPVKSEFGGMGEVLFEGVIFEPVYTDSYYESKLLGFQLVNYERRWGQTREFKRVMLKNGTLDVDAMREKFTRLSTNSKACRVQDEQADIARTDRREREKALNAEYQETWHQMTGRSTFDVLADCGGEQPMFRLSTKVTPDQLRQIAEVLKIKS